MALRKVLIVVIISIIGFTLVIVSNPPSITTEDETMVISPDLGYQETVDAFNAIETGEIPEHLLEINCSKNGTEFDVNEYFSVLTHIKMQEGYTLDYVYNYFGSGGIPILYVRSIHQVPYANNEEFISKQTKASREVNEAIQPLWDNENKRFEEKVIIDGTDKGFFEYIVLQMLAGQFYLFWHGYYNDIQIICDPAKINTIETEIANSNFGNTLTPEFVEKAKQLDYRPVIVFNENTVNVSIVFFTKWGGLKKAIHTIQRDNPYTITDIKIETLLKYDCGVTF